MIDHYAIISNNIKISQNKLFDYIVDKSCLSKVTLFPGSHW